MLGWPVPVLILFMAVSFPRLPKEPNLKVYSGANIRNVAMVGHGHAGKTSLVSAMLYTAGATQRQGRVDDGSATTDHDEEEIARKMSIATGVAVVEWGTTKINILDTPGFSMFVHEAKMALPVGSEKSLSGVVDLVRMKAYTYELGGNGKGKETEIPASMRAQVQEAHEMLVELVAEGDDRLMEKFFADRKSSAQ